MAKAGKQTAKFLLLLEQARAGAKADAATKFSSHLDYLIRYITERELNRVEITELLSQESARFHETGLSRGEYH